MRIDIMLPFAMAAVLMTATVGGSALAADQDSDREAAALQDAKVSLVQAITLAEQQTGGQAFDTGVDVKDGQTRISVETNGPKGVQTIVINAQSGQVVAAHAGGCRTRATRA